MTQTVAPKPDQPAGLPRHYKWMLLAILTGVYASHSMDRAVIAVVLELVKQDFELTDGQAGAIGGLAYGLAFCAFVIPVGWLADRTNRRNLLAGLIALWSGFTLLAAASTHFIGLLLTRCGVGAAEAGGGPVSMSLMSDVFPARQRSVAVGFLYLGLALGQGAIFLVGGYLAARYGWRAAYLVAGVPGILLAILILVHVRETRRGAADERVAGGREPAANVFRHLKTAPDLLLITLAATCCSIASSITWMWMPSLLIRSHGLDVASTGIVLSIATGICSGLGSVAAGPFSSWIVREGSIARLGFVAAGVALLATPLGMTAILSPSLPLAVACVFGLGVMLGAWLPPAFGMALAVAPAHLRAGSMSVIQFSTNLFSGALAPFAVGLLSDAIGGEDSLVVSMSLVFPVMFVAALAFVGAALKVRAAARRAAGTAGPDIPIEKSNTGPQAQSGPLSKGNEGRS